MNIALDFDGVISDCGALKSEHAKKMFGVDIPADRFKRELVVKELAGEKGQLTMLEYKELQRVIYGTWEVGMTMKPVLGVQEFLPKLQSEGHHIHIVTSRIGEQLEIASEWAKNHGFEFGFTGVGYGKSKAPGVKGFELFVDDDLDKLEPLMDIVPHRYLFSWGYNQHIDEADIAKRVASWEELYNVVQTIHVYSS